MSNYLGTATDDMALASLRLAGPNSSGSTTLQAAGKISQALTPVSVAAATCAEQTFTVQGLRVGDFVDVTPPGITPGVAPCCARVSANNTLAVTFVNPTAGALVPLAGTYQIQLNR